MSREMAPAPAELCPCGGGALRHTGTLHIAVRPASWLYGAGALGDFSGVPRTCVAVDV
ncbi:hypothetical protein GCM10011579_062550 [Streptomyces albiflavescens]|uniref:Uncharacterized protein n=1 Tax=Streptomyces albiflavescens TaxID=1623582 RepID=A0A918D7Y1_9ACTN|nr:hypothetical protein [Streptomyces albiflavescens]GGN78884.1 hypothetical protein GCM10011579_062550 [Streptomyces albiflavescens]